MMVLSGQRTSKPKSVASEVIHLRATFAICLLICLFVGTHNCVTIFLHPTHHSCIVLEISISPSKPQNFTQPSLNATVTVAHSHSISLCCYHSIKKMKVARITIIIWQSDQQQHTKCSILNSQVFNLQRHGWSWRLGDTCEKTQEHHCGLARTTIIIISRTRSKNTIWSWARPRKRASPIPTCYGILPPSFW